MWPIRLNAVLGSLVVTVGFWLISKELTVPVVAGLGVALAAFLSWAGTSVAAVWAWTVLLLGVECLAWPFVTMIATRMVTANPTEQQMGEILTAVVWGLPSGIFWTTLSWGLFKRLAKPRSEEGAPGPR